MVIIIIVYKMLISVVLNIAFYANQSIKNNVFYINWLQTVLQYNPNV